MCSVDRILQNGDLSFNSSGEGSVDVFGEGREGSRERFVERRMKTRREMILQRGREGGRYEIVE